MCHNGFSWTVSSWIKRTSLVLAVLFLTNLSPHTRAQTVVIDGSYNTTQNLDTLYPGDGERTALVASPAVVDVPAASGDGVHAAHFGFWTLTNDGIVAGNNGVYLGLGGTVTNNNEITGRGAGQAGIYLANGGGTNSVVNTSTGTITGGSAGVVAYGINSATTDGSSFVDNSGRIYAYGNNAVILTGGGTVTNHVGGIITGGYGNTSGLGVYLFGPGTVDNSGAITGNGNSQGVAIMGTGTVVNRSGAHITGNGATIGVWISGGTGTVVNEGDARITGGRNGVVISGSGTVTNDGVIEGLDAGYYGIRFSNTNAGTYTTTVTNSGIVSAGGTGLSIRFVPGAGTSDATNTITNTGIISTTGNTGAGVSIEGNGAFTNQITNTGIISGPRGILLDQGATGAFANQVTNTGIIEGTASPALEVRGAGTVTNSGVIRGPTGILFTTGGADTLTNAGTITGTGGTAVDLGGGNDTVTLNTGSTITGTLDGGAGTDALTLTGTSTIGIDQIANFETTSKEGAGTWTLTGTGSSGGSITVTGGTLVATGTINDPVQIGTLGTLKGTGATAALTNNGRVAPGNSIGTLTVNGDYTHAEGAIYEVEVNPAGQSDKIEVTGHATLNGGTVQVLAAGGSYQQHTDYQILHADNGVTGTFADVTSNLAFLDPSLTYTEEDVTLSLTRNQTNFRDVAQTDNQRAVAGAVDAGSGSATGDAATVLDALVTLDTPGALAAFDQMGGASYTAVPLVDVERTYRYMRTLFYGAGADAGPAGVSTFEAPSAQVSAAGPEESAAVSMPTSWRQEFGPWGFWGTGFGVFGQQTGDNVGSRFHNSTGGAAIGTDYAFSNALRAGVNLGYSHTQIDFGGLPDEGRTDAYQVALYGIHTAGRTDLQGAFLYGYDAQEMTRRVTLGGIDREARSDYGGHDLAGYLEGGYTMTTQGFDLRPSASLFALHHQQEGFSETGADSLNLDVDSQSNWSLKSALGIGVARDFGAPGAFVCRPQASARWVHEFGDNRYDITGRLAGLPAAPFTVRSDEVARDSAVLGVGLTGNWRTHTQLLLFYDAYLNADYVIHALTAGLAYRW